MSYSFECQKRKISLTVLKSRCWQGRVHFWRLSGAICFLDLSTSRLCLIPWPVPSCSLFKGSDIGSGSSSSHNTSLCPPFWFPSFTYKSLLISLDIPWSTRIVSLATLIPSTHYINSALPRNLPNTHVPGIKMRTSLGEPLFCLHQFVRSSPYSRPLTSIVLTSEDLKVLCFNCLGMIVRVHDI